MSIRSVLQSTFSSLYPRASDADNELLQSLAVSKALPDAADAAAATGAPAAAEAPSKAEADAYDLEITHIESRLQSQLAHSQRLTEHFRAEATRAKQIDDAILQSAEFAHGVVFRKLGLPIHESNFKVDPALAKNTGLLDAHELLREVQQTRAEAMCEPDDLDLAAREASVRPDPHYLDPTANQRVRHQTSQVKRAALVSSARGVRELRQTKSLGHGGATPSLPLDASGAEEAVVLAQLVEDERRRRAAARRALPPGAEALSLEQLALEEDVLRRMQAPLKFLRNPRHQLTQLAQLMTAAEAPLQPPRQPYAGMGFHVRPQTILFGNYAIGGCYEIPLELHNVDSLSRRLRVLPPSSPYFSVGLVQYPGPDGFVAPGLHAKVLVRFAPDSLGDYEDFLLVQTESDSFGVPLRAAREPPVLSLGEDVDVGWCFVGDSKLVSLDGVNKGGDGKFAFVSREQWAQDAQIAEHVASEVSCACDEFTVTPRLLDVPAGQPYELSVRYSPSTVGEHAAELLLVCDNCHVRPVRVVGRSCAVDMLLESIDGAAPPFFSPQSAVSFAEIAVGGSRDKLVRYSNRTPLPISFKWDLYAIAREQLPASRFVGDSIFVFASDDCDAPRAHGDGANGMPFSIEPAEGALPPGAVVDFAVRFAPQLPAMHGAYAHLAISGVPLEAMPGVGRSRAGASLSDSEVGLQLDGRGTSLPLEVEPRATLVPAPVRIDVGHRFALSVRNPNQAPRTVRWRVSVVRDAASAADGAGEQPQADDGATVEVEPALSLLPALGSATVHVTVLGRRAGRCVRNIECLPDMGEPTCVRLELSLEGPRVVVTQPVLDFGLVALGESPEAELAFENPTLAPARWWLAPASDGSYDEAKGTLSFSQSVGVLEPGEATSVRVRYQGLAEHELAAALSLSVTRGATTHVGVRAQVVAHRLAIDQPLLELGVTYVRVPAHSSLVLRNLTLLPTAWDFGGAEAMLRRPAQLRFEPEAGVLAPAATQEVAVTLTSQESGALDAVLRCAVPHMLAPLGLRLRSQVHGLVVSYSVEPATGEGTPLGRQLDQLVGQPHSPPAHAFEPPPALSFGRAVPCHEERHLLLVLRNHSSVPTRFHLRARDHPALVSQAPAPAPPMEGLGTATLAASLARGSELQQQQAGTQGAAQPRLGDAYESLRRFQSSAGVRHVVDGLHVQRKRALFASGDEVAFETSPAEGVLPPWGRVAVVLSAHTQMWGLHSDFLVSELEGLPLLQLPLEIGVVGSPLSLSSNAVGFSMRSAPPELAFSCCALGHAPIVRRLLVRNDSSFGASVDWGLFRTPQPGGKLLSAALAFDPAEGRVRLRLGPAALEPLGAAPGAEEAAAAQAQAEAEGDGDEDEDEGDSASGERVGQALGGARSASDGVAFVIEPQSAALGPHSSAAFTVTFRPDRLGSAAARLVARCSRVQTAQLEALEHPPLALDVRGDVRQPRLELSVRRKLKLSVSGAEPPSHESYRRELLIANRDDATFDFALSAGPPFEIADMTLSAGATTSRALRAQTGEAADAPPRLVLPPGESVAVRVQFRPVAAPRPGLAAARDGASRSGASRSGSVSEAQGSEAEDEAEAGAGAQPGEHQQMHRGALLIAYGNGARQHFPLLGVVHVPALVLSSQRLAFARKHVSVVQALPLEAWNPSRAACSWAIEHVPPVHSAADDLRERTTKRITGKPQRHPRDMPSIFAFSVMSGRFEPEPGQTPSRMQIMVRCTPTEAGLFRSRYRFAVAHGTSAEVDVEVEVTLNEEDDAYHITERQADDFVFRNSLL